MRQRSRMPLKEVQNVVAISALSSTEHIVRDYSEPFRVLSDIYLHVDRAQSWGISARTGYEIRLLLEIMGNIRPYDSGKCVLVERGMMRHKRVIQPHVFYIGDADMLYGNMNVLEYLMFATARVREDRLSMQEELFGFLVDCGLENISLTTIRLLSSEEKAIVELIAAAYSGSMMIVFNLPEANFDGRLRRAAAMTAELIIKNGKSLIIGTKDSELIQKACTHTAFIADGRIIYQGATASLCQMFDRVAVVIDDPDIAGIKQRIEPVLSNCSIVESGGSLLVKTNDDACEPRHIYQAIIETGSMPSSIKINEKKVSNAFEELIRRNDLSKQLF